VHRLDKETSGVMLFAKDTAAQRHLSAQFQNNKIEKEYLALVAGRSDAPEGEIDAPIAPHPTQRDRMSVMKKGKPARTAWKVEKSMRRFALLRCFPKTGRTHQIRVHLQSIGLPLAVDPLYNPPAPGREAAIYLSHFKRDYRPSAHTERPLISRLTLHAEVLRFEHPDGRQITIECPAPKDFRATVNQLAKL
jgi:23S rRNA pseudouridine1911/1915/1917 synthase